MRSCTHCVTTRPGSYGLPRCSISTNQRSPWWASLLDERSLAIRLELLDDEATLTDERIDAAVAAAVQRAARLCGAHLRT